MLVCQCLITATLHKQRQLFCEMANPSPPAHSRCTPFAGKCSLDQGGEGHGTHAQLRDTTNMLVCQCLITARLHKQRQLFIHMAKPSPPAHSRCTPFAGKCSLDQGGEGHATHAQLRDTTKMLVCQCLLFSPSSGEGLHTRSQEHTTTFCVTSGKRLRLT